jgi:hypothetical protein
MRPQHPASDQCPARDDGTDRICRSRRQHHQDYAGASTSSGSFHLRPPEAALNAANNRGAPPCDHLAAFLPVHHCGGRMVRGPNTGRHSRPFSSFRGQRRPHGGRPT